MYSGYVDYLVNPQPVQTCLFDHYSTGAHRQYVNSCALICCKDVRYSVLYDSLIIQRIRYAYALDQ